MINQIKEQKCPNFYSFVYISGIKKNWPNQGCSMNNVEMSTFSSLKQVRYWELDLDQDSVSEIVVEFKRNKPGKKKTLMHKNFLILSWTWLSWANCL